MPRSVSATEAKNRLGALLGDIVARDEEVIVERQGRPQAVLMSYATYQDVLALRERRRREDALARLRALREQVRACNQDLAEEQALEIADRFAHDVIDDLAESGRLRFERDRD